MLSPEQFDAAYGKGAHDEVHSAAASQSGLDGAGQRAQGPAAHDGETGASVGRPEGAGHAAEGKGTGPASEAAGAQSTRGAGTPADERASAQHQVDESASGDALARDDHEPIVDKRRKVRKPLPKNASAQRTDGIRSYKSELSKLGFLTATTE